MGIVLGRRSSVREVILAQEVKIEAREKSLKRMKRQKDYLVGGIVKVAAILNVLCFIGVWIFKEAMPIRTLVSAGFWVVVADAVFVCAGKIVTRVIERSIEKTATELRRLKDMQRKSIEELKKETRYYDTQEIIERYGTPVEDKEEPEESVVEKLLSNLI